MAPADLSKKKNLKPKDSPKNSTEIEIKGKVSRVFHNSPNWSAGVISLDKPHYGLFEISAAGVWSADVGERVCLIGEFVTDKKWGKQFKVKTMSLNFDMSKSGLIDYLAKNKAFKGLGVAKATKLVNDLGDDFESVIETQPKVLCKVAGISIARAETIQVNWINSKNKNKALTQLMSIGLTLYQATTLMEKFGEKAVNIIKKNPYVIIEHVDGMGFLTVDAMALKAGHKKDSPERIEAGLKFQVSKEAQDGHCYTEENELIKKSIVLLTIDSLEIKDLVHQTMKTMIDKLKLYSIGFQGMNLICKPSIYYKEKYIFSFLRRAKDLKIDAANAPFNLIKGEIAPTINDQQRKAASTAAYMSCIITGGAGTGKSYTLDAITQIYSMRDKRVLMAAPTGKAARRMEQATGGRLKAYTIHRLLEYDPKTGGFLRDNDNPLDCDLLVIDEFSMVDVDLCYSLFLAVDLKKTRIIITGDHNQLPSIGCGNLLRDMIALDLLPVCELTEIMRQGGVLKKNCNEVLSGKVHKAETDDETKWIVDRTLKTQSQLKDKLMSLFENKRFEENGFDPFKDVQVLSPQKKGDIGTVELNKILQQFYHKSKGKFVPVEAVGKKPKLYEGDRVIQIKNDYEIDVMNGTLGYISGFGVDDDYKEVVKVEFETGKKVEIKVASKEHSNIQLAYALTIHKVQGSEFPCVVVICHKAHTFMHHRNLLYTAVTRAKNACIILGDRWGVGNCAKVVKVQKRRTLLPVLFDMDCND
jgi:exodeoxyribonuclease V alpha subunit